MLRELFFKENDFLKRMSHMSTRRRKKTSFSDPLPASICPHAGSTLVHTCSLPIDKSQEREREREKSAICVDLSINVSMTGVMAVSAPLSGEAGGGENSINGNGLLGTTSRDAFQKIVSSHTSTQVV